MSGRFRDSYPLYAGVVVLGVALTRNLGVGGPIGDAVRKMTSVQGCGVATGRCAKSVDDAYLVGMMILSLFFARFLITRGIFAPLSHTLDVSKSKRASFVEMGWQFVWYTLSWLASMYFVATEIEFDVDRSWVGQNMPPAVNPHISLSLPFKLFYLAEIAFWVSMIISTPLAPRQKDFPVMVSYAAMCARGIFRVAGQIMF